jgi:hypothetical protein
MSTAETVIEPTVTELFELLSAQITELSNKLDEIAKKVDTPQQGRGNRQSQREMTDDDARQVLSELAGLKHNEAAEKLHLSYGQVYSCRLGYTFKHIRKELTDAKIKNQWLDTTHNG